MGESADPARHFGELRPGHLWLAYRLLGVHETLVDASKVHFIYIYYKSTCYEYNITVEYSQR